MIGIYCIHNIKNDKIYIGSSIDIKRRWKFHKSRLRRNVHVNQYLQSSWNKYGKDVFEFLVLMTCPKDWLFSIEQLLLDELNPEYNLAVCAEASRRGLPLSEEHKRKIGAANRGKVRSKELRKQIGDTQRGKPKPGLYGIQNGRNKLDENDVRTIRKRLINGESQRKIADDYNVHNVSIHNIAHGKTWGWLD